MYLWDVVNIIFDLAQYIDICVNFRIKLPAHSTLFSYDVGCLCQSVGTFEYVLLKLL